MFFKKNVVRLEGRTQRREKSVERAGLQGKLLYALQEKSIGLKNYFVLLDG